jgi:hypothetical protein
MNSSRVTIERLPLVSTFSSKVRLGVTLFNVNLFPNPQVNFFSDAIEQEIPRQNTSTGTAAMLSGHCSAVTKPG